MFICVGALPAWCPGGQKRALDLLKLLVEPPYEFWEWNPCPLQEQSVYLTAEPSPPPCPHFLRTSAVEALVGIGLAFAVAPNICPLILHLCDSLLWVFWLALLEFFFAAPSRWEEYVLGFHFNLFILVPSFFIYVLVCACAHTFTCMCHLWCTCGGQSAIHFFLLLSMLQVQ